MAIEDYLDPEVGVAVAVSAVVFSPPVRRMARRGAVYGLAGIMMAGDALASLAGGIGRGVRQVAPAMAAGGASGAEPAAGAVSGATSVPLEASTSGKQATTPETPATGTHATPPQASATGKQVTPAHAGTTASSTGKVDSGITGKADATGREKGPDHD